MRILHVITTLDVGGAEMHLLAQVRGQCARGHAVRVVWLRGAGTLAPDFRAAGAEHVESVGSGPLLALRLWPHLRWAERVHSHLLKADMATAVLATLAGRRRGLVASKHNDEQVLRRFPVGFVHGVLGRLPRRTIVLSDHVGRFVEEHGRIPRARQTRIYYGLDPRPFAQPDPGARAAIRSELGLGAGDCVFVCVARFAKQKAHDVLLRAFASARAAATAPTLRLLLVGDDPFGDGRERTEALAQELDLLAARAVILTGVRRDVPALLAASDAFVMSSLWEGLGLVFLEAMAAGLPVLATRVSGVPEVVVPLGEKDSEPTGILVEPGAVEPLAHGFLTLARDPALRARLGRAGSRRVAERFGLERMIEETLAVYTELGSMG